MPPKVNKIEAEIRRLSKLDGNKTCADCPEKVPGYVDLTHNVFLCTKCSGIHREYQFKVKGVSMSVFSAEDVEGLAAMGNDRFNSIYLANLNPREYTTPNGNDINKLKEFIRMKYLDKRWHRDGRGGSTASFSSETAQATSTSNIATNDTNPNRISLKLNTASKSTPQNRRASTGSVDIKKPSIADNLSHEVDLLSLDSGNTHAPSHSSFDPFGSSTTTATNTSAGDPFASASGFGHSTEKTVIKSGDFDPFGGPSNPADPFDPFGPAKANSGNGFDPFTAPAASISNNSFDAFGSPPTQQTHLAPMPFIQVNPPAPVTEVSHASVPPPQSTLAPPKKDFGAFDDLLSESAPVANLQSSNPFDTPYGGPPVATNTHTNVPHSTSYGYPAPPPNGAPSYGGPTYQSQPYGVPNYPQNPYPPQPGYPSQPYFPNQQQMMYSNVQTYPGAAAPPHAVSTGNMPSSSNPPVPSSDPFAAMSSLAWTAAGGSAPSTSTQNKYPPVAAVGVAGAPVYPMSSQPTTANTVPVAQPPPQQQSVNPFDLF